MNIEIKDGKKIIIECTQEEAALLGSLFCGLSVSNDEISNNIKDEFQRHINKQITPATLASLDIDDYLGIGRKD